MNRINNNNQQAMLQKAQQQKPAPSTTRKAGAESAFANKMNKKQKASAKKDEAKPKTSSRSVDSEAILKRQGMPVMRRGKGTVADLQAQLEGQSKGKTLTSQKTDEGLSQKTTLSENTGLSGADKNSLSEGLTADKKLTLDKKLDDFPDNTTAGALAAQNPVAKDATPNISGPFEIKDGKIPTAMLDKMVENVRVGVNAAGNAEFQFDLNGDVLGGLKMQISMDNGQLKATFLSENPEIRSLIDGNLQDLKKALEDRGIYIRDLEIRDPKEKQREQKREQNQKERREAWEQG